MPGCLGKEGGSNLARRLCKVSAACWSSGRNTRRVGQDRASPPRCADPSSALLSPSGLSAALWPLLFQTPAPSGHVYVGVRTVELSSSPQGKPPMYPKAAVLGSVLQDWVQPATWACPRSWSWGPAPGRPFTHASQDTPQEQRRGGPGCMAGTSWCSWAGVGTDSGWGPPSLNLTGLTWLHPSGSLRAPQQPAGLSWSPQPQGGPSDCHKPQRG